MTRIISLYGLITSLRKRPRVDPGTVILPVTSTRFREDTGKPGLFLRKFPQKQAHNHLRCHLNENIPADHLINDKMIRKIYLWAVIFLLSGIAGCSCKKADVPILLLATSKLLNSGSFAPCQCVSLKPQIPYILPGALQAGHPIGNIVTFHHIMGYTL